LVDVDMFGRRNQQAKQGKPASESDSRGQTVRATLKNFGHGELEFADNILKFSIKKGAFGRKKDIIIRIPLADIENIKTEGTQIIVTWNGINDVFTLQNCESMKALSEELIAALSEVNREQTSASELTPEQKEKEEAEQRILMEIPGLLSTAFETVDPLFDLLRSLQGKISWTTVQGYLKRAKENAEALGERSSDAFYLNFTNLSKAIESHVPGEAGKEVYSLLNLLYAHFVGLASKTEAATQIHPNYCDAQIGIRAYYTLNDIILGVEVGDEETVKESAEFSKMLDQLTKETHAVVNTDVLKDIASKIARAKGAENAVPECRALFKKQLEEITKPPNLLLS
jgi:hypothetical protein